MEKFNVNDDVHWNQLREQESEALQSAYEDLSGEFEDEFGYCPDLDEFAEWYLKTKKIQWTC
jgi:hypothetical protein